MIILKVWKAEVLIMQQICFTKNLGPGVADNGRGLEGETIVNN